MKFKILSRVFWGITLVLSHRLCAMTAYTYCNLLWGGKYGGFSAPPSTAFYLAIPSGLVVALCAVLALVFHKKGKKL